MLFGQPVPDTLWTLTYGGIGMERAFDVDATSDGGLIVAGGQASSTDGIPDMLFVKVAAEGSVEWAVNYGEGAEEAFEVCQTSDGGYVAAGYTTAGCVGQDLGNAYIVRLNSDGDSLWTRVYNFGTVDDLYGVVELDDGSIVVAGSTIVENPTSVDPFLIKLDADGNHVWTQILSHPEGTEWVFDMICTNDGGFALAGLEDPPAGDGRPFAMKLNAEGDEEWLRSYQGGGSREAFRILETPDGGYFLCGNGLNENDREGYSILRLNAQGDTLWTRLHFTVGDGNWCHGAEGTADGGVLLAGNAFFPDRHISDLVKLDANGCIEWHCPMERGVVADLCNDVCIKTDGCIAQTGLTANEDAGDVFVMMFESVLQASSVAALPANSALFQNYPNPFNPTTTIAFDLTQSTHVALRVFDLLGQQVAVLANENLTAGHHAYTWDGGSLPSGVYVYRFEAGAVTASRKMLLIK